MATRLYLRDAAYWTDVGGTLPVPKQSNLSVNADVVWPDFATLRQMSPTIGAGQVTASATSLAQTTQQGLLVRGFASRPLAAGSTVGLGSVRWNLAALEANAAANWNANSVGLYVWRPSTGLVVGFMNPSAAGIEPGTSEGAIDSSQDLTSVAVSALAGDIICAEFLANATQSMAAAYNLSFFYDGTVETLTTGTAVSDHASFLELPENLTFTTPPAATGAEPVIINQAPMRASTY